MKLEKILNDNAFIIDSNDLEIVQNRLCGSIITKYGNLFVNEFPDDNIGSGCYVLIERNSEKIIVSQDVLRCFDIYIYQESEKFIISNSFFLLSERLKGKLSLNESYMLQLIYCYTNPYDSVGTLANEITRVPLHSHIEIDIKSKSLEIKKNDYQFFQRKFDPKESLKILDDWYFKWVRVFRMLFEKGYPIKMDLSGGLDSRVNFSILLSANLNVAENIIINNHISDFCDKDVVDRKIATNIANFYKFNLNSYAFLYCFREVGFVDAVDSYSILKYFLFGRSLYCRTKEHFYNKPCISCMGLGQMIKVGVPEETIEFYDRENLDCIKRFAECDRDKFFNDFNFCSKRTHEFVNGLTDPNLFHFNRQNLFVGGRDDKKILSGYLTGQIPILPLVDPQLWVFDPKMSNDKMFLSTLILSRYNPKLLEFPLQGNRVFSKETIDFAFDINSKFPLKKPEFSYLEKQPFPLNTYYTCFDRFMDMYLQNIYSSKDFRDTFKSYFSDKTVQTIIDEKSIKKRNIGNYRPMALLAIYEFLKLTK